jgi:hypothetical protein
MAFTGNYVCSSFKQDLLAGRHNFTISTGNVFKMSLHTSGATFDASTTAYSSSNEVSSSGTAYTTAGNVIAQASGIPGLSSGTAYVDFDDEVWSAASFTARGAIIYNDTLTTPVADASVVILDFLADKTATAGDFTVIFPTAPGSAIIRLA